ncbi:MAG: hypothetical protein JOZ31_20670 [Verrucomicrobia bacterium]|nr:hypothetical protein [Verrucomicrobiota bacterium]MBV8484759.1 hypothetical protein [Verrucomicrobiota bacterium]
MPLRIWDGPTEGEVEGVQAVLVLVRVVPATVGAAVTAALAATAAMARLAAWALDIMVEPSPVEAHIRISA